MGAVRFPNRQNGHRDRLSRTAPRYRPEPGPLADATGKRRRSNPFAYDVGRDRGRFSTQPRIRGRGADTERDVGSVSRYRADPHRFRVSGTRQTVAVIPIGITGEKRRGI